MPGKIRLTLVLTLLATLPGVVLARDARRAEEPLTAVMAGEFALQAGQLEVASDWYLQAARDSDDAGLAERATRIALLADEDKQAAQALRLWSQRAPSSLAMRSAEATLALRQGKARAARKDLAGLMADPDEKGWRYALVALAGGGRDPKLSARVLGELVDDGALPDDLVAWLEFARLAQRLDDAALSERIVAQVVERFPQEPRVALLHASQLRQAGKDEQARQILDGLQDQAAGDTSLRLELAQQYDQMGDPVAAARTMAHGPQDNFTYSLRASLLAKGEDKQALAALYDELKLAAAAPGEESDDPERTLLLGRMAEYLERPQEALDWYATVTEGGHRSEARLRSANTLHALERKPEAYAALRKLESDARADDEARLGAYLLEAELRQKDGDDAGELEVFARGLAAYPDEHSLLYSRGLAWERRDHIDRAEADFRRILVSDPENVAALNALGYTLADRTTRYQEALELIDRARVAAPDDAAIVDSYGWVLYRLGRNEDALVELRRAYTMQKDPEIAAHVGEVLWVLGRRDEARHYFEEARKLDPENRALQRALEKTGE